MTQRKPPGLGWESFIEQQIRESIERGEFDRLRGSGQPIESLDRPHDDDWWLKAKLRREDVSFLPPTLAVRKEVDDARQRIAGATLERTVRATVAAINERIVAVNRMATAGPPSNLMPLDEEAVVAQWRAARAAQPT